MLFRVLGSLEVGTAGELVDLGPPKQRALLAALLMHPGEVIPTDRLIDMLWGDRPPRTAGHSVQLYISSLRKALEPVAGNVIVTRPPGYQLQAKPDEIDAAEFERLIHDGGREIDAGDPSAGVEVLRSALDLWRGSALSEFTYEEFAQPYIHRLHGLRLEAIEKLAAAELEYGQSTELLPLLESAIREDPLRERSRELLMLALYRSGRHAEALRSYQMLRTLLDEDLGLEPSPPIQRLQERILLHDPALSTRADVHERVADDHNPYKGLRPFVENDARDFFGRQALVDSLVESFRAGRRLIALVGPSGSGKSSVVAAGLIPQLREGAIAGSDRWVIARMVPGTDPIAEVETVVAAATDLPSGLGHLLAAGNGRSTRPLALRTIADGARLLLVIDQFEELFTSSDEGTRRRFLTALTATVSEPDGQVSVLLSLRADFYDRPLLYPDFAEVFTPGVVNAVPMTALELEAAVVGPAKRVAVDVEPALVTELVREAADQPGALPLLQYALTELFEQKRQQVLTLDAYRELGGMRGVLSRRAETLYGSLGAEERRVAVQVFLRLVQIGRGGIESRRRVAVADLTSLGLDPVALSHVLDAFGRHRLLSFDHDIGTGRSTIEAAHEALFREWDRLASWIDRHRTALRRYETFSAAVEEWEMSGRDADYLLTGSRLTEFETWSQEGTLALTGREREFLGAGLEQRRALHELERERGRAQRRLERKARVQLVVISVALVLLAAAVAYGVLAPAGSPATPTVALIHIGGSAVDDLVEDGFDRAVSELGLAGREVLVDDQETEEAELRAVAADGTDFIIFTGGTAFDVKTIVRGHPDTVFVLPNDIHEPNAATISFDEPQGSFLAGAAAALKSRSHIVGFIGGMDDWFIWRFHAGFQAGALAVDPQIDVLATYVAMPPDFGAFSRPIPVRDAAREMYQAGADVIFHAAGGAGVGLFEAAATMSSPGRDLWAIGVDSDQYVTIANAAGVVDPGPWQARILTSMVKRSDLVLYQMLEEFSHGTFTTGVRRFGLATGAVDVAYSGGFMDDVRPRLDQMKASIISGDIFVPCVPQERVEAAQARGLAGYLCQP